MDNKLEEQTNRIYEERIDSLSITEPACLLCGSKSLQTLFEARSQRHSGPTLYEYISCETCRLAFLSPLPSNAELNSSYVEDYASIEKQGGGVSEVFSRLLAKLRTRAIGKMQRGNGRLLDIGCGKAFDIVELKKKGWDAYGVEITPCVLEIARSKLGQDKIFDKKLSECNLEENYFDVITMWHVFEHVDDPRSLLGEVYSLLQPGGMVVIESPNLNWFLCRLFKDTYASLFVPQHILYWSEDSLKKALKHFELLKVEYPVVNSIVGFSNGLSSMFGLFLGKRFERISILRNVSKKFSSSFNSSYMRVFTFLLLLPLSILIALLGAMSGKGESIRVFAKKDLSNEF